MTEVDIDVLLWAPPVAGPPEVQNVWAPLGLALAQAGVNPPRRTTQKLTQDWAPGAEAAVRQMVGVGAVGMVGMAVPVQVVGRGVAPDDLFWLAAAMSEAGLPVGGSPAGVCRYVTRRALALYEGCTVRSMLGWSLAGVETQDRRGWVTAGLGEDGWLYAAAGFTLGETLALQAAGVLDPAQAAMMAGLRGVTLPST